VIFLGSALSFVYMFQIYQRAFLAREPQAGQRDKVSTRRARAIVAILAALILALGLWPEPLLILGEGAAADVIGASGDNAP
jgi:multicomponent Na+:H+ antiporter subunit D